MIQIERAAVWTYLVGSRRPRRGIFGAIVGLLAFASVVFLLGVGVGLSEFLGWLWILPITAVIAGYLGTGLLPTVGSLWLISLWLWAFPPLVGYLTGEWTGTGRYTTPRMTAIEYGSARTELFAGLETAFEFGLVLAVLVGTVGYIVGSVIRKAGTHVRSS